MRKCTLMFVFLLSAAVIVSAQVHTDTIRVAGSDTITIRTFDKKGRVKAEKTMVGTEVIESSYVVTHGEEIFPIRRMDTVRVPGSDTITIRKFRKDGKLKWESVEFRGEEIALRDYYYRDSLFGYTESDMRKNAKPGYEIREFYPDSTPRIIGRMIKGKEEGSYRTFYKNGNPQCVCYYKDGVRDSIQRVYHENGNLSFVGNYSMGEENGVVKEYHENGNLWSVVRMNYGKFEDTARNYHENGVIWTEVVYRGSMAWEVISAVDRNGNPLEKGTLKDGNGTLYNYDEEDHLYSIEYYENGRLVKTEEK